MVERPDRAVPLEVLVSRQRAIWTLVGTAILAGIVMAIAIALILGALSLILRSL